MRLEYARVLDFSEKNPYDRVRIIECKEVSMKQLCKIEKEGKVSGVCAGLARYFNIDVTVIRLLWLMAIVFGVGSPVVIYIIMAIVLPNRRPDEVDYVEYEETYEPEEEVEEDPYYTEDRYK